MGNKNLSDVQKEIADSYQQFMISYYRCEGRIVFGEAKARELENKYRNMTTAQLIHDELGNLEKARAEFHRFSLDIARFEKESRHSNLVCNELQDLNVANL